MSQIVRDFPEEKVVIDDKSYFVLSDCKLSRKSGFYPPNEASKLQNSKFEPKILVCVAILTMGIPKPYIVQSNHSTSTNE